MATPTVGLLAVVAFVDLVHSVHLIQTQDGLGLFGTSVVVSPYEHCIASLLGCRNNDCPGPSS
jgi:hypothetical protein